VQNVACDTLSRRPCERGEGFHPCTHCRSKTDTTECRVVTVHDCSDEPRAASLLEPWRLEPTERSSGGPPSYETAVKWLVAEAEDGPDYERPLIDFLWPPLISCPLPPTLPAPSNDGRRSDETACV